MQSQLPVVVAIFTAIVVTATNINTEAVASAVVAAAVVAFVAIIIGGVVALFSFGILAPFASRWLYRYVLTNIRYGDRALESDPKVGALYRVWIPAFVLVVIGAAIAGLIGLASYSSMMDGSMDEMQMVMAF